MLVPPYSRDCSPDWKLRWGRNDQPSPEGGLVPPFGGYRHYCPCPLGGGGGGRRPGGVGGLRSKVLHRNGGWKTLSGAIAITAPAPLGAGEEAEGRAGSGGCAPKYYIGIGWKITHLYNLGCFNSILFTHMRVNRFFSGKKFIIMGVLLSTIVKTVE